MKRYYFWFFLYLFPKKETLEGKSPNLEEVVEFYLKHNKTDTVNNTSGNSHIAFRSDDSSQLESSNQSSIALSDSMPESDDSPICKKRKRKDSKSDKANFPTKKRSK